MLPTKCVHLRPAALGKGSEGWVLHWDWGEKQNMREIMVRKVKLGQEWSVHEARMAPIMWDAMPGNGSWWELFPSPHKWWGIIDNAAVSWWRGTESSLSPHKTTDHSKGAHVDTNSPTDTWSCVHTEEPTELTPSIQQCKALYSPVKNPK